MLFKIYGHVGLTNDTAPLQDYQEKRVMNARTSSLDDY